MNHLVFYRDTIQSFSLLSVLAGLRPAEHQSAYHLVEVKNTSDVFNHLMKLTDKDTDHLEDIHIIDVKPGVGKLQDELEAALNYFANVPFRDVFWVSNYGEVIDDSHIHFVTTGSYEHIMDSYLAAIVDQKDHLTIANMSSPSLSFFWSSRAYLTKKYENSTPEEAVILFRLYKLLGINFIFGYFNQAHLMEVYQMYKPMVDRYAQQVSDYIQSKLNSVNLTIDGVTTEILSADLYKNEIAEQLIGETNAKIAIIILEIKHNQTVVTIRTANWDARDVAKWMGENNAKGIYNATTIFIPAELTPLSTAEAIKQVKGAQ
mgnify:CR=1 FL=1